MIEVKNLYKNFGDNHVLKGINAKFLPGRINVIIGASGSGKSVFLKNIVGLIEPTEGGVYYNERNFTEMNYRRKKSVRQEIGMLFQGSALFDSLTVEQNVAFPIKMFTNKKKQEILERVNFCLERVHLENVNHLYPAEISGGMQKRVGIARAIALNPVYLFVDEPNSGLDPATATVIDQLIEELTDEYEMTTIMNSHDMNTVFEVADHIFFLHKGEIWWEGAPEDIIKADNKELHDFVFAARFLKDAYLGTNK